MTPEQFAYWLQGFAEINGDHPPTLEQWTVIHDHLKTVFNKVTPPYTFTPPKPEPAPWGPEGPAFIC